MSSATPTRPSAPDHSIAIAIGIAVVAVLVVVIGLIVLFISSGGASALGHWLTGTAFGTFVRYVLESLAMLVGVLLSTAVMIYAERKIWASVQLRRGPNVVGPWGTFQPFADFGKFILKEPIIPASANKGVFVLAPLVGVVLAFAAWAVIPVNDGWVVGNINVGILYLFAVSSLGVYGIIMAGWASNSKYPFMAALRSAAQMVSYEVSIGFVLVTVLLCANSLNLTDIVRAQDTKFGFLGWYWLRLLPMFVIFFISSLAETNRPPFDLVEAESELVAGHMVEYSASHVPAAVPDRTGGDPRHVVAGGGSVHGRVALAATLPALHLGAGHHLVPHQGLVGRIHVLDGEGLRAALPLRPVDAARLEGVPADLPVHGGAGGRGGRTLRFGIVRATMVSIASARGVRK